MMRIYISGKMGESPLSDETVVKFQRAEKYLKSQGWNVSNPADDQWQQIIRTNIYNMEQLNSRVFTPQEIYEETLLMDILELSTCNAIYMLPDWKNSPGATAEYYYAKACAKEIIMGQVKDILDHDYDLDKFNIPTRLLNCLKSVGIDNLEECTQFHRIYFQRIQNLGFGTLKELDKLMKENGFEYRKDYKLIKI